MKPDKQLRLLAGVRRGLSDERLDAYGIGRSEEEKLANYLWNVALCESVYPALHGLEIALRNACSGLALPKTRSPNGDCRQGSPPESY